MRISPKFCIHFLIVTFIASQHTLANFFVTTSKNLEVTGLHQSGKLYKNTSADILGLGSGYMPTALDNRPLYISGRNVRYSHGTGLYMNNNMGNSSSGYTPDVNVNKYSIVNCSRANIGTISSFDNDLFTISGSNVTNLSVINNSIINFSSCYLIVGDGLTPDGNETNNTDIPPGKWMEAILFITNIINNTESSQIFIPKSNRLTSLTLESLVSLTLESLVVMR
ncbi:MAG: hypothetical protein ACYTF1_10560 [Planctomycetota bacterium]|jgi:hypothetical protein